MTPSAKAEGLGVGVGGIAGVGESTADAESSPTVTGYVSVGTGGVTAGSLTVAALTRLPDSGIVADAEAQGGSGSLVVGIAASDATAAAGGTVSAYTGSSVYLPGRRRDHLRHQRYANSTATTLSAAVALAGSPRRSSSTASSNVTITATLGTDAASTSDRTGDLKIDAEGMTTTAPRPPPAAAV